METAVVVVVVIFLGLIGLSASLRTFVVSSVVVLGLLFFGPVVYRITVLGQDLGAELAFRAMLLIPIFWCAAKELTSLTDEATKN